MSPRLLTPLEGLWIELCHTVVLTGDCLWAQVLGAYLLLYLHLTAVC